MRSSSGSPGTTSAGPLIVVYDEAQNLSDQQTDLLMELEPTAFLLASATMRLPARLAREVDALKANGWDDASLITAVDAKAVADSGLVKNTIVLAGYQSPMEETVSTLLADFGQAESRRCAPTGWRASQRPSTSATRTSLPGTPTNETIRSAHSTQGRLRPSSSGGTSSRSTGSTRTTSPSTARSRWTRTTRLPTGSTSSRAATTTTTDFSQGSFRHIIFNLALQEGWDDPLCYFAYIDKSMESRVQVEQIIGRLLRQPGAHHYAADRLNSAHFYVRVDRNQVFTDILNAVNQKIASEAPELRVVVAARQAASGRIPAEEGDNRPGYGARPERCRRPCRRSHQAS